MKNKTIPYLFFSYLISRKFKDPENPGYLLDVLNMVSNKFTACSKGTEEDTYITAITEFDISGYEGFYFYVVKNIRERRKIKIENGDVVESTEYADEDKFNILIVIPELKIVAVQDNPSNFKLGGKTSINNISKIIEIQSEFSFKFEPQNPHLTYHSLLEQMESLEFLNFDIAPSVKVVESSAETLLNIVNKNYVELKGKLVPKNREDSKTLFKDDGIINSLLQLENKEAAKISCKGLLQNGNIISISKKKDDSQERRVKLYINDDKDFNIHLINLIEGVKLFFTKDGIEDNS